MTICNIPVVYNPAYGPTKGETCQLRLSFQDLGARRGRRRRRKRRMRGRIMRKRGSRGGRGSAPYDCTNARPQGKKRRKEWIIVVRGRRGGEGGVEVMVGVRMRRGGPRSFPAGPPLARRESYSGLTA